MLYPRKKTGKSIHLLSVKLDFREMVTARMLDHTVHAVDHEFSGGVCLP